MKVAYKNLEFQVQHWAEGGNFRVNTTDGIDIQSLEMGLKLLGSERKDWGEALGPSNHRRERGRIGREARGSRG